MPRSPSVFLALSLSLIACDPQLSEPEKAAVGASTEASRVCSEASDASCQDERVVARGPAVAPVTVTAFLDPASPACARQLGELERLLALEPARVRVVIRPVALRSHPGSERLARAIVAAERWGRGWEFALALAPGDAIGAAARAAGIDATALGQEARSQAVTRSLERAREDSERAGLDAVPAVFVGDRRLPGVVSAGSIRAALDAR